MLTIDFSLIALSLTCTPLNRFKAFRVKIYKCDYVNWKINFLLKNCIILFLKIFSLSRKFNWHTSKSIERWIKTINFTWLYCLLSTAVAFVHDDDEAELAPFAFLLYWYQPAVCTQFVTIFSSFPSGGRQR